MNLYHRTIITWTLVLFTTGTTQTLRRNEVPFNNELDNVATEFSFFDTEILQTLGSKMPNTNLVVAPSSMKSILALLYHGAVGETKRHLKGLLNLPVNETVAKIQLAKMQRALKGISSNLNVKYSNAVFITRSLQPKHDWKQSAKNDFNAEINPCNFANTQQAESQINKWVTRETQGLITQIIEPDSLKKDTKLVLANAMYFKGKWLNKFHIENTVEEYFYVNEQNVVTAQMMKTKGFYKFSTERNLRADVIQIPFQDPTYSLVVILPTHKGEIQQLLKYLNHNNILKVLDQQELLEVRVALPKFKIDVNLELKAALTEMMKSGLLFTDSAQLQDIAYVSNEERLKVDTIVHKATIEINEDGAIASAATGSAIVPLMTPTTEDFYANHPFAFMIYNSENKIILFEGVVHTPNVHKQTTQSPFGIGIRENEYGINNRVTNNPIIQHEQMNGIKQTTHFPNKPQSTTSKPYGTDEFINKEKYNQLNNTTHTNTADQQIAFPTDRPDPKKYQPQLATPTASTVQRRPDTNRQPDPTYNTHDNQQGQNINLRKQQTSYTPVYKYL